MASRRSQPEPQSARSEIAPGARRTVKVVDELHTWARAEVELEDVTLEDITGSSGLPADDHDLVGWRRVTRPPASVWTALVELAGFLDGRLFDRVVNLKPLLPRRRGPKRGSHRPDLVELVSREERDAEAAGGHRSQEARALNAGVDVKTYLSIRDDLRPEK